MDIPIRIAPATPDDSGLIWRILERSIRSGCAIDHRNDARAVQAWIGQYGLRQIDTWLREPSLRLSLAWHGGKPVGIAMVSRGGDIGLCHVQPEFFHRGIGQALMADVERYLQQSGCRAARVWSTRTALEFYLHLGYRYGREAICMDGVKLTPLSKWLAD